MWAGYWNLAALFVLLIGMLVVAQTVDPIITINNTGLDVASIGPAGALVKSAYLTAAESIQLTDEVVANLTATGLPDATLFEFGIADSAGDKRPASGTCKNFPGDKEWPSDSTWKTFNALLGGHLIATVPSAASCYSNWPNETNAAKCTYVTNQWGLSPFHAEDPTSVMWPLYQGRTCMPTNDASAKCTLGGYPSYAVNISNAAQVQLAVNFARNTNIRLIVKNTGHDFSGKSAGAGAISVWTHYLKEIKYIPHYQSKSYTGQAVKMGSGVQAFEIYAAAKKLGFTVIGGEGRTVGIAGGYIAGGGHSPLSSIYGMGADQVVELEVVTPNGRFVTVSSEANSDLFWALRGGGGSTYGVVTSITVKAHPVIPATAFGFSFTTSTNVTSDTFWAGVRAYYNYFIPNSEAGTYSYFQIAHGAEPKTYVFNMAPFFAPNMTIAQTQGLLAPWFADLAALDIPINPVPKYYDNFYDAWWANFPLERVGISFTKSASRLFPKSNWEDERLLNATFSAIRNGIEEGGVVFAFNLAAAPKSGYPDNGVNPAWRKTVHHCILGTSWPEGADDTTIEKLADTLTNKWMKTWRDVSPGAGAYMSESDISEPNFQQSFYGSKYDRLYTIKQRHDPWGVFYAVTAVGSEDWFITDQHLKGILTQNGRLCRV